MTVRLGDALRVLAGSATGKAGIALLLMLGAISVYVLVAIIKKRLNLDISLYTILQILSVSLFEKTPILQALAPEDYENDDDGFHNQLMLFD